MYYGVNCDPRGNKTLPLLNFNFSFMRFSVGVTSTSGVTQRVARCYDKLFRNFHVFNNYIFEFVIHAIKIVLNVLK